MSSSQRTPVAEWIARGIRFLLNYPVVMTMLLCFAIPLILYGAKNSWLHLENRVEEWLPAGFEETVLFRQFADVFGSDELLIVTWEGCSLDSPELVEFQRRMLEPHPVIDGHREILFQKVISGKDIYEVLSNPEFRLSDEQIKQRLEGYLLSKDRQHTSLIAKISPAGRTYRQDAVQCVWDIADSMPTIRDKMHVGGATMDSVSIDKISQTNLIEMNLLSYAIGIFISYLCFKNFRVTMVVFLMSLLNQQICMAMIYYSGIPFSSILMLCANLTFVLSMSAGIHLVHYYHAAIRHLPPRQAINHAVSTAIGPTFISIATTVVGLLSFMNSQMIPIKKFGMISSISLGLAILMLMIYIPLHFVLFPVRQWHKDDSASDGELDDEEGWLSRTIVRLFYYPVKRFSVPIIIVSLILGVVFGAGAMHLQTNIGLYSMLRKNTRPIQDYTWIEENFGPLIPVEVMIAYPQEENGEIFSRLKAVDTLVGELKTALPETDIISLLNFIPDVPTGSSLRDVSSRKTYIRQLGENRAAMEESGFFVEKDGKQYWRITIRTFAMRKPNYGPLLTKIQQVIQETLDKQAETAGEAAAVAEASPTFIVTGSVPLFFRAQQQLLSDLKVSFATAFIIIGLILIVLYRSIRCGLYAVFPSLLPVLLVFGIVGWLGVRVEIGTMLTGSAALAIAVDNTVHFIAWFRIAHRQGMNRQDSVLLAYQKCGVAMAQTAAVCSFGLITYIISPFIPILYFSFFMFTLLMTSLLCDLTVMPAILLRRAGDLYLRGIPVVGKKASYFGESPPPAAAGESESSTEEA